VFHAPPKHTFQGSSCWRVYKSITSGKSRRFQGQSKSQNEEKFRLSEAIRIIIV
jgi:hypothetical protein